MLNNFYQTGFSGKLGDPTGIINYKKVDTISLEIWETVINNPLQRTVVQKPCELGVREAHEGHGL